jgi:YbbR domain-containing protein
MNKKFLVPFKKFFKLIYNIIDRFIVVPISTLVYKIQLRFGKENKLEKLLNRPNFLLYLSLVFAILLFYLVENKAVRLVNTEAEYLTDQPVKVLYNSGAYVVEGIPETVDITLIGKKSELYLAKQLGDNEVVVDLTDYEPSDKPVEVKLTYNKNLDNIDYKIDPTYVTVTIKKKVSDTKTINYDLLNQDDLNPKLSVRSVELSKSDVVVRGSQETLNSVATIKALIDLDNTDYNKAGTYTVDNVTLVAYGSDGNVIKNVEIVATKITATLVLDSYSKKVPVKVLTEGALVDGKAISSITINGKAASEYEVTIYGDENSLETIENIPVTLDIAGLGNSGSKTLNVSLPKPSGVRSIVDDSVSIVLNFGEAKQKTVKVVGIKTINVPSGLVANLASAEDINVDVQVIGVESVIDALGDNPTGITAYVDLSGCVVGGPYPIDVKVVGDDSRLQYVVTKKVNVVLSKSS